MCSLTEKVCTIIKKKTTKKRKTDIFFTLQIDFHIKSNEWKPPAASKGGKTHGLQYSTVNDFNTACFQFVTFISHKGSTFHTFSVSFGFILLLTP